MAVRAHAPDYVLIGSIMLLTVFGLVMLASATAAVGFEKFGSAYYFLKRQVLFGFIPGIAIFIACLRLPYRVFVRARVPIFLLSLLLLVAVLIPGVGTTLGGAKSWLIFSGVSFQPSEILKIALIVFLAGFLEARRGEPLQTMWHGIIPFLFPVGVSTALLAIQPDVGTLAIVLAISFGMVIVAGARLKHIAVLLGGGALVFGLLVASAPYRVERFTTFLHPELDPQGAGYQINQSFLALGTGGWFGEGLGHSRQKFQYLPEVASDSIFAIIGEELGFVATASVILLILLVWFRLLRIARAAPDTFGRLTAFGIGVWFLAQSFLNIGAMVGLLPITGLPLPFVSHGGTALLSALAAAGIAARISAYTKPV